MFAINHGMRGTVLGVSEPCRETVADLPNLYKTYRSDEPRPKGSRFPDVYRLLQNTRRGGGAPSHRLNSHDEGANRRTAARSSDTVQPVEGWALRDSNP